ncbi:hypothetical protein M0R04_02105 [Candidatus Dojkabacteria bacterium]|jgi:hypothetical protein|nr:hypothetical protein [Candidatus Dojkabacteria bacterium]
MIKRIKKKKENKGDVLFNVPLGIKHYLTPIAILVAAVAITAVIVLSK